MMRSYSKNDRKDRQSDHDSYGKDAHFADFTRERPGVNLGASTLCPTRARGALSSYRRRSCG